MIKPKFQRNGLQVQFTWERGRVFDRAVISLVMERCLMDRYAKVFSVTIRPTSKWRPLPLTTVELQKLGTRFLGMNAKRIMDVNSFNAVD